MRQYFINVLVGIDQLINAVLAGNPDETLSSRCGKAIPHCVLCKWFCRFLDVFDPNHCIKHIEYDEK